MQVKGQRGSTESLTLSKSLQKKNQGYTRTLSICLHQVIRVHIGDRGPNTSLQFKCIHRDEISHDVITTDMNFTGILWHLVLSNHGTGDTCIKVHTDSELYAEIIFPVFFTFNIILSPCLKFTIVFLFRKNEKKLSAGFNLPTGKGSKNGENKTRTNISLFAVYGKKTTELPYYLRKNTHTKSLRYNSPSYTLHLYSDVNKKDLNTETVPVVR